MFTSSGYASFLNKVLLGCVAISVIFFFLVAWQNITFPYQIDYGEAPLLEQAIRLQRGETLADIYVIPQTYPFRTTNYPPLFFAIFALFVNPDAPTYTAGRLLAILAALVVAGNIFLLIHKTTRNRQAALVGMLIFLIMPSVVIWFSFVRIDFLAMALSLTGLTLLVYWPNSKKAFLLAIILMVLATYTRQTYVFSAPLAGFVYLWSIKQKRRAFFFAAAIGSTGLLLLLLLTYITGGGFWFHVGYIYLGSTFLTDWYELLNIGLSVIDLLGPLCVILAIVYLKQENRESFLVAYACGSLIAIVGLAKPGASVNYLLEMCAAVSVMVGIIFGRALETTKVEEVSISNSRRNAIFLFIRRHAVILLLIVQVIIFGLYNGEYVIDTHTENDIKQATYKVLDQQVKAANGFVLTDDGMGLLVEQGYPILFQPFDFSQMARRGLWDQTSFLRDIESGKFDLVIIYKEDDDIIRERWTDEMLASIRENYTLQELPCCYLYEYNTAVLSK